MSAEPERCPECGDMTDELELMCNGGMCANCFDPDRELDDEDDD